MPPVYLTLYIDGTFRFFLDSYPSEAVRDWMLYIQKKIGFYCPRRVFTADSPACLCEFDVLIPFSWSEPKIASLCSKEPSA